MPYGLSAAAAPRRTQTEGLRSQRVQPDPLLTGSLCTFLFSISWGKANTQGLVTVSNSERKRKGGGKAGLSPDLKFIALRRQNLDFLT